MKLSKNGSNSCEYLYTLVYSNTFVSMDKLKTAENTIYNTGIQTTKADQIRLFILSAQEEDEHFNLH